MKKILMNYGGAILLYSVIFFGIIAVSSTLTNLNDKTNEDYKVVALKH